jgi:hypothetical protein
MCDNIAALHPVRFKKKLICVSHSHLPTFTVVHPFSSTLYHIQDVAITHLNNFILLAQGNISGTLNDRSHHNGNERRRTRVPQDYQATSGCTLEAAATFSLLIPISTLANSFHPLTNSAPWYPFLPGAARSEPKVHDEQH